MSRQALRWSALCVHLLGLGLWVGCGEDEPRSAPDMTDAPAEDMSGALDMEEGCPALTGAGVEHTGWLEGSQVWTAADSPHIVSSSVRVVEGMTLTLEPCAVVLLEARQGITVAGELVAQGLASRPVRIEALDPTKPFASLRVEGAGELRLEHTRVAHGGDGTLVGAMVETRGSPGPRREVLMMEAVELDGSATFGVSLEGDAGFSASSRGLTIKGASSGPMSANPKVAGTLPPGAYEGNGVDEVLVVSSGAYWELDEDTVWPDRGVPYRVEGQALRVGRAERDAPEVRWTLEPGVTVRMMGGEVLMNSRRTTASPGVDVSNGTLVAVGSAAAPITFEGVEPIAGSWRGLVFRAAPTAQSRLEHVIIAHAGGPSRASGAHCWEEGMQSVSRDEDAALTVFGPPSAAFVTSSIFRASARDGINHAYYGELTDLMPTNTFEQIGRCNQTMPRPMEGLCPEAGYCPR